MMVPRWVLEFSGVRYLFLALGNGTMTRTEAWYSPGFAIRLSQSVIHWTWEGMLPETMVYAIAPEGAPPVRVGRTADHRGIELNHIFVPLQ
jgi:hypothetical protein